MTKIMRPKSKKGQVLVFTLMLMAIGLIVITPLLHFLDSSYTAYKGILIDTDGYYTADAMMNTLIVDMASGQDVLNQSALYNKSLSGGWLNGCNVSTSINSTMYSYMVPDEETDEWTYLDPGCGLGLGSLAHDANYSVKVYLTEGSNITVNWYFDDIADYTDCDPLRVFHYSLWPYYCLGDIWIAYENGSPVGGLGTYNSTSGLPNKPLNLSAGWSVPINGSGNYSVIFRNRSWRYLMECFGGQGAVQDRSTGAVNSPPAFGGTGDLSYTWIKVGEIVGGSRVVRYRDYTITTTATRAGDKVASVTAVLRQAPGPLNWWPPQDVEIVSWQVSYY